MKTKTILMILALVAVGVGGSAYYRWQGDDTLSKPATTESDLSEPATDPEPPKVRYPIAKSEQPPSAPTTEKTVSAPPREEVIAPAPEPLPVLDASDPAIADRVGAVVGLESLERLFNIDNFVRRIVVTVDNLPRRQVPPRYTPVAPVGGKFQAQGEEGSQTLSEKNYSRYEAYVKLLETVDIKALVAVYAFLYPLFQEAYEDLGYPDAYFNDRVVEAIDDLLAAPELPGPIELARPSVMFKYADPDLERLSAGQKIMIRMGPANARRVKSRLQEVRYEITRGASTVKQAQGGGSVSGN